MPGIEKTEWIGKVDSVIGWDGELEYPRHFFTPAKGSVGFWRKKWQCTETHWYAWAI
jgi:hypothetical protein